jgi:proline iminopeptidase
MARLFAFVLLILLIGQDTLLAKQPAGPFKISFEEDGKRLVTKVRLRLKYQGKITEINYIPGKPLAFPKLEPREPFDLWIITDRYTLPFLEMPGSALEVAGWRVGIDARPFDLKYYELRLLPASVRLVYYIIYKHADGGETPIWIESSKPAEEFRSQPSDSRATEGYFAGADGVRLFYRKLGIGPSVAVFLHGGPGSNFRGNGDFMEPLAARRTVIMYDQRGSGLSEIVTEPKLLTAEHHIRDLEALRQHFRIKRMTIIGLSWGSALAAMYAAAHPERVERLLLVSPMSPTKAFADERRARLNLLLGDATVSRRNEIVRKLAGANDDETVALCRELSDITFRLYLAHLTPEKLRHAASRCNIPPAAIRNRAVIDAATFASIGEWDLRPMLTRLRMPALIVEGTETNVPLDATRVWTAVMPNARLLLIPKAGHELFLDQPTAFAEAAEQFLSGRFPKGAEIVRKAKAR